MTRPTGEDEMSEKAGLTSKPKFGEWLRGIYASESNPQRDGMYVRTIRRTGRMNPGTFYEMTDGNGRFWQYPAQSVERVAAPQPAAEAQQPFGWIVQDKDSGEFWPDSLTLGSEPAEDDPDDAEWVPLFLAPPVVETPQKFNPPPAEAQAQGVGEVEYEFEVWQDDSLQAGGSTSDYATAKSEADHYALMYGQDGPVEVHMYEKRRIAAPPSAPVGVEELTTVRFLEGGIVQMDRADYDRITQQPAAVDEVDWRAMYRHQTAMRYMDNNAQLTKERAYRMADNDVAALELQQGGNDSE